MVHQNQKVVRAVPKEEEGLLVDPLTTKNLVGIQALLLVRERERGTIGITRDEFKKAKPPTFDGEVKTGQEVEAWLLGIKKYFQV